MLLNKKELRNAIKLLETESGVMVGVGGGRGCGSNPHAFSASISDFRMELALKFVAKEMEFSLKDDLFIGVPFYPNEIGLSRDAKRRYVLEELEKRIKVCVETTKLILGEE